MPTVKEVRGMSLRKEKATKLLQWLATKSHRDYSEISHLQQQGAVESLRQCSVGDIYLHNEAPFFAYGLMPQWHGRSVAWALFHKRVGRRLMLSAHRAARRFLDHMQADTMFRRVDATVQVDNHPACRWCQMLGFRREGCMKAYDVMGRDCYLYARVRHV